MKHLIAFFAICSVLAAWPAGAQEVISSGGTHATGSGISLSWTIGEMVTETFSGGGYILTQGFHQTRLSLTAVEDIPVPGLSLSVYPNPFLYILNVKVSEGDFSQLQYTLFSMDGKALENNKLSQKLNTIDMQRLVAGNYLLRISRHSGETIKTFKVTKQ